MSNEKLPEGSGWKDRLDDPEGWSDWKPAEKEAAWGRLHERLGTKPHRKGWLFARGMTIRRSWPSAPGFTGRGVWYWAAASLLIIIIGLGPNLRKGGAPAVAGNVGADANNAVRAATGAIDRDFPMAKNDGMMKHDLESATVIQMGVKSPDAVRVHRGTETRTVDPRGLYRRRGVDLSVAANAVRKSGSSARVAVLTSNAVGQPIVPADPLMSNDTGLAFARAPVTRTAIRPPAALRVVHNNELNPSGGPRPSVAGNSSPHRLKLSLLRTSGEDIFSEEDQASPSIRPHITIPLSSQN